MTVMGIQKSLARGEGGYCEVYPVLVGVFFLTLKSKATLSCEFGASSLL